MACAGRGSPPFFTPRMRPHYFQVINLIRRGCTSEGVERGGGRGVGVFFFKELDVDLQASRAERYNRQSSVMRYDY